MTLHFNRDAVGGVLLAAIGAFISIYAYTHYPIGQISRMGPGMFPVLLGVALVLIAVAIIAQSAFRGGDGVEISLRSASLILVALAAFAVLVRPFGIVPALLALLLISSLAVPGRRLVQTVLFSAVVTGVIVFIFAYVMNLNLVLFRLPA